MKDNIIIENKFSYDFNHLKNPRKFGDLLLYQLGEIYCNNSAVVEPHIHNDFFELTYICLLYTSFSVLRGKGRPTAVPA